MDITVSRWLTCLEKCLLFLILFAIIHPNLTATTKPKRKVKESVCSTSECKSTASRMLSYMKADIDPCDNFYNYACGGFLKNAKIPNDSPLIDQYSPIEDLVNQQLKTIMSKKRSATDPKYFQFPYKYYNQCMNTKLIEKRGAAPMQAIVDSLGGWPVVKGSSWDPNNNWSWVETIKDFRRLGFDINLIVYFYVDAMLRDNSKRIIFLDSSKLGIEQDYLTAGRNDPVVSAYYDYMVDVAVLFGANRDAAKKELEDSLQFELTLTKYSLSDEARNNITLLDNTLTIKEMQQRWSYINWIQYINSMLLTDFKVDENEKISVTSVDFLDKLGPLLAKTPKRTIANYLMFRIHSDSLYFLSEKFHKRKAQFDAISSGQEEQAERWKECVKQVNTDLSISVGSLYVQKHFSKMAKSAALEMIESIHSSFQEMLKNEKWMDPKTKAEAEKKLEAMQNNVGYPNELIDNNKLAEYYSVLDIQQEDYFNSYLKLQKFALDASFSQLRLPLRRSDWKTLSSPTTVNTYYDWQVNGIEFPAAMLQGIFFNVTNFKYMNYGAIGWLMGHETTHGFDNKGRQYDENGNLKNWWQKSTEEAFMKKANCIVEQYNKYIEPVTKLKVNGANTEGENIADNGGIKEAYFAYKKWLQKNGREPQLPGMKFTNEQMFWLAAGQSWCTKATAAYLKDRVSTNVHAPTDFRVIGAFSNFDAFAKDFNCPAGSPMNPVNKCAVW